MHASLLWIAMFLFLSTAALVQVQGWLRYVRGLGFEARLAEIRKVSELPEVVQRDRVSALVHLLRDEDRLWSRGFAVAPTRLGQPQLVGSREGLRHDKDHPAETLQGRRVQRESTAASAGLSQFDDTTSTLHPSAVPIALAQKLRMASPLKKPSPHFPTSARC